MKFLIYLALVTTSLAHKVTLYGDHLICLEENRYLVLTGSLCASEKFGKYKTRSFDGGMMKLHDILTKALTNETMLCETNMVPVQLPATLVASFQACKVIAIGFQDPKFCNLLPTRYRNGICTKAPIVVNDEGHSVNSTSTHLVIAIMIASVVCLIFSI